MAVTQQVVVAGARSLGESALESLIEGAVESVSRTGERGRDLFLDLRSVAALDPYALATLAALVRFLAEHRHTPYILLPQEERALATLHAAGFGPAVQPYCANNLRFEIGRREAETAPILVPLAPIHAAADVAAVRTALARARDAVCDELGFATGEAALVEAALVEVAQNVWQHSEDWGFLCVGRGIQPRTERRSVTVAVADLGIGIRSSLAQRYELSDWTDAEAILHAAKPGYSRCEGRRGIGLTQALAVARRFDGSLTIRSGAARVHFADRRFHFVAPFPGVQVALTVREPRRKPPPLDGYSLETADERR